MSKQRWQTRDLKRHGLRNRQAHANESNNCGETRTTEPSDKREWEKRTYPCRGGGRTASWGGSRGSRASGARTCGETSSPPPPPYLQDITTNPSDPPRAQRGRLAPAATKWPPPASERGESRREEITPAAHSLRSPVGGGGAAGTGWVSEEPDARKP
jgi:hypothetical protein